MDTKEVPMMIPDCYDPVAQAERLAMEQDKLMEDTMCCSICRCTLYPGNKYHKHQCTVVCPSCLDGLIEGVEYVGE